LKPLQLSQVVVVVNANQVLAVQAVQVAVVLQVTREQEHQEVPILAAAVVVVLQVPQAVAVLSM
jgi:hypothetical protein